MVEYLTLHDAAKIIPGADAEALKRMHRRGKLRCYRPTKALLTTAADVHEAIRACHVDPKVQDSGSVPLDATTLEKSLTNQLGLSSMEIANSALDSTLARLKKLKKTR